jgi:hypothetical protein
MFRSSLAPKREVLYGSRACKLIYRKVTIFVIITGETYNYKIPDGLSISLVEGN